MPFDFHGKRMSNSLIKNKGILNSPWKEITSVPSVWPGVSLTSNKRPLPKEIVLPCCTYKSAFAPEYFERILFISGK